MTIGKASLIGFCMFGLIAALSVKSLLNVPLRTREQIQSAMNTLKVRIVGGFITCLVTSVALAANG